MHNARMAQEGEEIVYVGVDVAKNALDVAATDSRETWQFVNEDEAIS